MQWFGPSNRIEYIDDGDDLLIRITSIARWMDLLAPVLSGIGAGVAAYLAHWYVTACLAWTCFHTLYDWCATHEAELRISGISIRARIKTPYRTKRISREWREIFGLEYGCGAKEDDPSGLYIHEPGAWTILVKHLDQKEAEAILKAIHRRFHDVETRPKENETFFQKIRSSASISVSVDWTE